MLRLPQRIRVRLRGASGELLAADRVLIAINIFKGGRYYYGNLLGLTGADGCAELSRDELQRRFLADRAQFPMDYRVPLQDADPVIEVVLMAPDEIGGATAALRGMPQGAPEVIGLYEASRNSEYQPAAHRFAADLPGGDVVVADLTTSPLVV